MTSGGPGFSSRWGWSMSRLIEDAPEAAPLHPSGKRYHVNCGGEVRKKWRRERCDVSDRAMECGKCGTRWSRGRGGWIRVRAAPLTWIPFR